MSRISLIDFGAEAVRCKAITARERAKAAVVPLAEMKTILLRSAAAWDRLSERAMRTSEYRRNLT